MEQCNEWAKKAVYGMALIGAALCLKNSGKALRYVQYLLKRPVPLGNTYGAGSWAMVTGGSKGIGLEFAKQLGNKGFNVMLYDISKGSNQKAVEELSKACGSKVQFASITGDITEPNQEFKDAIEGKDFSILVNSAGIAYLLC